MPQNFYELVWIFIIYAFIGWCTEVSYATLDTGKFVNRGFLNGPYCPVYGCGVVIVVAVLTPLKDNLLILFAGSFLLTSVLEFITGYILEKVFHNQWWDYSDKPFNIKGYVCLKFSIYWGMACTFIMDVVHPIIYETIVRIPFKIGVVILVIIMTGFAIDLCVTVSTILKFNRRLKLMDDIAVQIHKLSDEIGENIYENVTGAIEKSEAFQENHAELIGKLNETKEDIMEIPGAAKGRLAETTEAAKEKIAETTGAAKEKLAETTGAAKEKLVETTDATKEKIAETTGAAKERIVETTGATKEKIAETTGAAKEKIVETTGAAKEKIVETTEAAKEKLVETTGAAKERNIARREEYEAAREAKRKEREELTARYKELLEQKNVGFTRLLKAFPDMKSHNHGEALQKYKERLNIKKLTVKKEKEEA
jgi:uncharacterized membrane protein